MRRSARPWWCILCLPVAGCGPGPASPYAGLEDRDPGRRILAVVAAAETAAREPDQALMAALVDRLDDEDSGVRFFAIAALDRVTGRRFGYRAHDSRRVRRVAVERWRRHLEGAAPRALDHPSKANE